MYYCIRFFFVSVVIDDNLQQKNRKKYREASCVYDISILTVGNNTFLSCECNRVSASRLSRIRFFARSRWKSRGCVSGTRLALRIDPLAMIARAKAQALRESVALSHAREGGEKKSARRRAQTTTMRTTREVAAKEEEREAKRVRKEDEGGEGRRGYTYTRGEDFTANLTNLGASIYIHL